MSDLYQYQRLEGQHQFRVLELQPALSRDDPLEFRLHLVAFDKHPKYAAISYTWDEQALDQEAVCNGSKLLVSSNCSKILRRLRPPFAYTSVYLWIDQICINQSSHADKALNVSEMGAIYQQATSVLVWIGDFDQGMAEGLMFAAQEAGDLGARPDTITEHWVSRYNLQRRSTTSTKGVGPAKDSSTSQKRSRVDLEVLASFRASFQKRRWFQRLWTFQEAIVPLPHHVYFMIDKYAVPLDIVNDRNYGLAHEFYSMRSTNTSSGIADVAHAVRNRQCQDPRDRCYAIYSVLRLPKGHAGHNPPMPNYTKRTRDVFVNYAWWAFGDIQDAKFLYLAPLSRSELDKTSATTTLPSWVPDLHRLSILQRSTRKSFYPDKNVTYSASKVSKPHFDLSSERWLGRELIDRLTFKGAILDSIDFVTEEIQHAGTHAEAFADSSEALKMILESFLFGAFERDIFTRRTWASVNSSFWRAIMHTPKNTLLERWQEECLRWIFAEKASLSEETKQLARYRKLVRDENGNSLPTTNLAKHFWPPNAPIGSGRRTSFRDIFDEIENHRIFLTRSARVGVALGDVQKEDKVVLASGFSKILILRKTGEYWSLVGHGFVDGLMSGEEWPTQEAELEKITLI